MSFTLKYSARRCVRLVATMSHRAVAEPVLQRRPARHVVEQERLAATVLVDLEQMSTVRQQRGRRPRKFAKTSKVSARLSRRVLVSTGGSSSRASSHIR